jgi:hypothetical protein
VREFSLGGSTVRVCYSQQGPPWLELLEGAPGSPWDPAVVAGPHHVGCWVDDLAAASRRLAEQGLPVELDARPVGAQRVYHGAPRSGLRVELFPASDGPDFLARWGLSP